MIPINLIKYFVFSTTSVFLSLWAARQLYYTLRLFVKNDNLAKAYTLWLLGGTYFLVVLVFK